VYHAFLKTWTQCAPTRIRTAVILCHRSLLFAHKMIWAIEILKILPGPRTRTRALASSFRSLGLGVGGSSKSDLSRTIAALQPVSHACPMWPCPAFLASWPPTPRVVRASTRWPPGFPVHHRSRFTCRSKAPAVFQLRSRYGDLHAHCERRQRC
jgi:hypothetical protein